MKLYFPESHGQLDFCGYNHLVKLFNKVLSDRIVTNPKEADFRVYCNLPWYHAPKELKKDGLPLMVYTMYESTKVPSGWVKFLNDNADVVLVPSQWCHEVFLNSGVKVPIFVLSGCYDSDNIKPIVKSKEMDKYVFLWQGVALDKGGRKGADIVFNAFKQLKKEGALGEDARLIMKYRPYEHTEIVFNGVETSSGIKYVQANLTRSELHELYASVDCCINPTHGEGFGLIPLEQMAMGKPVIVTGWSMDYLKEAPHVPIKYKLKDSPVVWNHKFLRFNRNGFAYNLGGLVHEHKWLPMAMKYLPDGRDAQIPGFEQERVGLLNRIYGRAHNTMADIQKRFGLFVDARRKPITVYQENPGLDAWANIEDLKDGMLWAYKNREQAFQLGFDAGCWAEKNMGLFRMREDFERIEADLMQIANNHKTGVRK